MGAIALTQKMLFKNIFFVNTFVICKYFCVESRINLKLLLSVNSKV